MTLPKTPTIPALELPTISSEQLAVVLAEYIVAYLPQGANAASQRANLEYWLTIMSVLAPYLTGNFVAGGDLSGTNTDQTVIGLQTLPLSNSVPSDGYVLTWDGYEWIGEQPSAGASNTRAYYGSGTDGSVVFDGSTTVLGLVPVSDVYTLVCGISCVDITINPGVTVITAGCPIWCTGTLTNNGIIDFSGNSALGSFAGPVTYTIQLGYGTAGGAGAAGASPAAAGVSFAGSAPILYVGYGGTGGTGGNGGAVGGTLNSYVSFNLWSFNPINQIEGSAFYNSAASIISLNGGTGGGGGGEGENAT